MARQRWRISDHWPLALRGAAIREANGNGSTCLQSLPDFLRRMALAWCPGQRAHLCHGMGWDRMGWEWRGFGIHASSILLISYTLYWIRESTTMYKVLMPKCFLPISNNDTEPTASDDCRDMEKFCAQARHLSYSFMIHSDAW